MKSLVSQLGALLLGCLVLGACDQEDKLSRIGESIQSPRDKVDSELHRLQFEASSVKAESVYSSGSTTSLLGEISDPLYGDFHGEFVARLRTAPRFKFAREPLGGKIDSVKLMLGYERSIGDVNSEMKLSIYEVKGLGTMAYSTTPEALEQYRKPENLIGEKHLNISSNSFWRHYSARDSVLTIALPIDTKVGQRIYDLSKEKPYLFDTQESFDKDVLGSLLVTPTTGRGNVLQVVSTALVIYYTYTPDKAESEKAKGDKAKKPVATEAFISTKLTGHINALSNPYSDVLLVPSDEYFYIKQPAGVIGAIELKKEQMARLLKGKAKINIGSDWSLADAQMQIDVKNPKDLLLNPPSYMLLIPKDSVTSFFAKGLTERSRAATSYLSSRYSVSARFYNFSNIARLVTEHLKHHARYSREAGWSVDRDLELRLVPVDREITRNGEYVQTIGLNEFLFPSFVRLDKRPEKLQLEVVSSQFSQ